jgi:hypothetical protein
MVPVSIDIDDRSTRRTRRFRAQILRHPLLTPQIAAFAASNAIVEFHGQPGDTMARMEMTVEADEVGRVTRRNVFFDPVAIGQTATEDLVSLLRTLSANPFYPVGVRSIRMNVVLEPRRDTAQIERIFVKQGRFEPGETAEIGVVLKPFKREPIVRTLAVRIPANLPAPATLSLLVQGGGASGGLLGGGGGIVIGEGGALTLGGGGSSGGRAVNLKQLVRRWQEREQNNEVVARLLLPTTAVTLGGEKMSNLPPAFADVLRSPRSSGVRLERDEVKVVAPTPFVLSGAQSLTIRVARRGQGEQRPAAASVPFAPSSGSGTDSGATSGSAPASRRGNRVRPRFRAGRIATTAMRMTQRRGRPPPPRHQRGQQRRRGKPKPC